MIDTQGQGGCQRDMQHHADADVSSVLLHACCTGKEDPGAPQRADKERKRTYKTKSEVDKTRGITSTIVLVLLGISVVVPMLQYWGYTSKE